MIFNGCSTSVVLSLIKLLYFTWKLLWSDFSMPDEYQRINFGTIWNIGRWQCSNHHLLTWGYTYSLFQGVTVLYQLGTRLAIIKVINILKKCMFCSRRRNFFKLESYSASYSVALEEAFTQNNSREIYSEINFVLGSSWRYLSVRGGYT